MEVRWRLFARDVLSMPAHAHSSTFLFGRPLRPVLGLRLLGVIVYRSRAGLQCSKAGVGADAVDVRDKGIVGVDDGTGVVEVRLSLALWEAVSLWDQVDVVGRPLRRENPSASQSLVLVLADGCHVETDPNVATLRALECIKLYKLCYFSPEWSPSAIPLPPQILDPWDTETADNITTHNAPNSAVDYNAQGATSRYASNPPSNSGSSGDGRGSNGSGNGGGNVNSNDGISEAGAGEGVGSSGVSLEEQLSAVISNLAGQGGATVEKLHSALGVPAGDIGVATALAQMQLDGAIYVAGDRYMPL